MPIPARLRRTITRTTRRVFKSNKSPLFDSSAFFPILLCCLCFLSHELPFLPLPGFKTTPFGHDIRLYVAPTLYKTAHIVRHGGT